MERIALYNDSFQNWKTHDIKKAQLILTDIPYQLGRNAYGSNPMWYKDGDNANGESEYAGKTFLIPTLKLDLEYRNSFTSAVIC